MKRSASILMTRAFIWDPPYLRNRKAGRIDYWGIGFLAVAIGALQVMLDKGEEEDWFSSHLIQILSFAFLAFLVAFIVRELTAKNPVVHLTVFKAVCYTYLKLPTH